jgi:hypothetical protein
MTRKTFIRVLLLGALGWLGVKLMFRRCSAFAGASADKSGRAGCSGCGEFARCSLPWKEVRR